jgi:hypothetical protein
LGSKKEQRLARQAAKAKLREGKRAYEVQKILETKNPIEAASTTSRKIPSECKIGESNADFWMVYETNKEDRQGQWSWGITRNWHPDPGDKYIYDYLNDYTPCSRGAFLFA